MNRILPTLVVTFAYCAASYAAAHKFPEGKPVASIEVPAGWKLEDNANGVELTSDDGEVFIAIQQTTTQDVGKSMDEAMEYLKKNGVTVHPESMKKSETKIGGNDAVVISWDGNDEEGPARIQLTIATVTEEQGVLFVYWASPDGEQKHQREITALWKSLKKA